MGGDITIVAADHLDAYAQIIEIGDRPRDIALGRIDQDQKTPEGEIDFVLAQIMRLRRQLARGDRQNPASLRTARLKYLLQ